MRSSCGLSTMLVEARPCRKHCCPQSPPALIWAQLTCLSRKVIGSMIRSTMRFARLRRTARQARVHASLLSEGYRHCHGKRLALRRRLLALRSRSLSVTPSSLRAFIISPLKASPLCCVSMFCARDDTRRRDLEMSTSNRSS